MSLEWIAVKSEDGVYARVTADSFANLYEGLGYTEVEDSVLDEAEANREEAVRVVPDESMRKEDLVKLAEAKNVHLTGKETKSELVQIVQGA